VASACIVTSSGSSLTYAGAVSKGSLETSDSFAFPTLPKVEGIRFGSPPFAAPDLLLGGEVDGATFFVAHQ